MRPRRRRLPPTRPAAASAWLVRPATTHCPVSISATAPVVQRSPAQTSVRSTSATMTINTNGGGLDLTGVGTPTVNIVLGGLTAGGGTVGANLAGMNETINLASGTLSGAS